MDHIETCCNYRNVGLFYTRHYQSFPDSISGGYSGLVWGSGWVSLEIHLETITVFNHFTKHSFNIFKCQYQFWYLCYCFVRNSYNSLQLKCDSFMCLLYFICLLAQNNNVFFFVRLIYSRINVQLNAIEPEEWHYYNQRCNVSSTFYLNFFCMVLCHKAI